MYALQETIPIIELLKEIEGYGITPISTKLKVRCRVFEDNSGALEMAKTYKYHPCTKHLNVKLHHFWDYVERGEITIEAIDTTNQLTDYLTKPVSAEILKYLRKQVMGW